MAIRVTGVPPSSRWARSGPGLARPRFGRLRRSAGTADDQFDRQQRRPLGHRLACDAAQQQLHRLPPGLGQRHAHGGQRRRQVLGERDVVAADHGHVGGHPAPGLPQRGQHADGHHVAVHEDRREAGRAFEQQPGRRGAAVRRPVALDHQVLARLQARGPQRVLISVQPAAGDPPPEQPGDGPDPGVPEAEQVIGGQPPGVPVIGPHRRHPATGHRLQAHRRHVPAQQVGHLGVFLYLRRRGDDAVHPPLDQRPHDVDPVRAAHGQVADQDRVPVPARLLLGGDRSLRDGHIGRVAGHQADGGAGPLDQAPRDGVRPVTELGRRGQDPLRRLGRYPHVAAVQQLAGGLKADPGPRRDLLIETYRRLAMASTPA